VEAPLLSSLRISNQKDQVSPNYLGLLKRMKVHGKVKLEVSVAQDGRVKSVRVVGGHPLLAPSAEDAVKQWRFESGPSVTLQMVEFDFK
jgi:TonB family protein